MSAVVSDPDGIDDVIGGQLKSGDGVTAYGAFGSGTQKGAYEFTLSWAQIQQVKPINFKVSQVLPLSAEFFDQAGHKVAQAFSITLQCFDQVADAAACNGLCSHLATSTSNCGSCGNSCAAKTCNNNCLRCDPTTTTCFDRCLLSCSNLCNEGTCETQWSACVDTAAQPSTNCDAVCKKMGELCVYSPTLQTFKAANCALGGGSIYYSGTKSDCTMAMSAWVAWFAESNDPLPSVKCLCTKGALFK